MPAQPRERFRGGLFRAGFRAGNVIDVLVHLDGTRAIASSFEHAPGLL